MFETAGSLAIVTPASSLFWLVALPLAWAAVGALAACASPRGRALLLAVAVACAAGTLALAIALTTALALLPPGHLLLQHVSQIGRLGQLDLALDLALDGKGATFAVVIAAIACASALHTSRRPEGARAPRLAWTGLTTSGAMLACLGDGFAPILVGLGLLSLAGWGHSRAAHPAADVASLAGDAMVLVGFVFLFWSLGGVFGPAGYDPDGAPRFVLVTRPDPSTTPEKATLSMTSHAGALVSSDGAALPGEPISAPFSIAVDPGVYTLRVHRGAAAGEAVVPRVGLVAGRTHVLTPFGPTASLRALSDQLAVPRVAPTGGAVSVRAELSARTIAGLRASAVVLLLVLGGALAHVHALARRRGSPALASTLEALPAPYLTLRLAPLVDPRGADGALVMVLGVTSALVLAGRAAGESDPRDAARGLLASASAVALVATGLGAPAATVVLCLAASAAGAVVARRARAAPRWSVALQRPYAVLGLVARGAAAGTRYLARSVRSTDRALERVVPLALRSIVLGGAAIRSREARVARARIDRRLERAAQAIGERLGLDHPRAAERVRTGILLALMAVLALVVLSSVLFT